MKAAVFHGPGDVRFGEVATPEPGEGEALIRVRACGICGSDLHTYRHGMFRQLGLPVDEGLILGHEFSGEVVETRGTIEGLAVGDRVIAAGVGGNAEYYVARAPTLPLVLHVPDDVSFEEAATTEPLATSLHAVNLAEPADAETIVVLGAGIIGLGVLQTIRARCSAKTIVVDLSDRRLALAEKLGAAETVNARRHDAVSRIGELTDSGQANVDTVFDCAGVTRDFTGASPLAQALSLVRPNGKVLVVAAFEKPIEVDFNLVMGKGLHLIGSFAWSPAEFAQALDLLSSGKVDRRPLITHEFALENASEAYETQLRADEAVKVLLKP
ncbi:MAG: zinc-binding dehydrogenase [Deltaproteobacteria bacterium]|nr:zinc-binding dehydrogenase [Deltaproteobacteria bacterium]MBW2415658.1 zinc-binding dehydrogenase [Deltaproteobacteria bacterium]